MIFTLIAALAATTSAMTPAPAAPPAGIPADAAPPPPADGARPHFPRQQVFVAPSGAVFRGDWRGPSPKAAWFAAADADHDGRLDAREFTADFAAFAATLDTNHDGVIDAGEIAAYEAALPELHPRAPGRPDGDPRWLHRDGDPDGAPPPGAPPPGFGRPRTPPPPGLARFALLPDAEPVAAMDADHDSRITRDEVLASATARFAALDTGHKGYLTLADLPETWSEARRREMRARMEQGGWGRGENGGRGHGWGAPGGMGEGGPGPGGAGPDGAGPDGMGTDGPGDQGPGDQGPGGR